MLTYEHRCREHGRFEVRKRMAEGGKAHACPLCGGESPQVVTLTGRQIYVPGHFGQTLPATRIKSDLGGGGWETLHRDYNRWDSPLNGHSKQGLR